MLMLIFLFLMAGPEQGGKVVLNAGVPEADFYLDGSFVAVTDAQGMLTMENFPAGSFSFSIVKRGYSRYTGSFSIGEGETKRLSPILEKLREPDKAPENAPRSLSPPKPAPSAPRLAGTIPKTGDGALPIPAEESKSRGIDKAADASSPEADAGPSLVVILLILFAIASIGAGFWVWKKRLIIADMPPIDPVADTEMQEPSPDAANRQQPVFLEELKRREELINAGFVGSKSRVVDPSSMKDKEVVIVLPKEAFRYEDDK